MQSYINQAQHNEKFHGLMCDNFEDDYFDWKITCLFYVTLHAFHALAAHKGVKLGNRHHEMMRNMNPKNSQRLLQVKSDVFEAYDALFTYSWTARYDGFTDFETFQQLKKNDHQDAIKRFNYIKKYMNANGISF